MTAWRAVAVAAGLALAGCATGSSDIEVTRFHLGVPIPKDRIAVVAAPGTDAQSLEFRTYADAVARELAAAGFAPGTPNAYRGVLKVEQTSYEGPPKSSGLSIGLGGFTGGNVGVGGSVAVPVGGNRPNTMRATRLSLAIVRESDNSQIWEGRAEQALSANSPAAGGGAPVPALARALLKDFPGTSGQTVKVKPGK